MLLNLKYPSLLIIVLNNNNNKQIKAFEPGDIYLHKFVKEMLSWAVATGFGAKNSI